MKVLLVNGSPKARGCTYTALMEIVGSLDEDGVEWELYHIGSKSVHGCTACDSCRSTGRQSCIFNDDNCNELLGKMLEADGIVIGSPVYFSGPNGALCALLDRIFYCARTALTHKPSAAIVSCRRSGGTAALDRLNRYFTINQMPLVTSEYWNAVHGMTAEEVLKDAEGIQIMRILGHNMAWALKNLSGKPVPKGEPYISTNFIR